MTQETLEKDRIEAIVLDAVRATNLARDAQSQLEVSSDAKLYAAGSSLDSLALVGLLIDIEESLIEEGFEVSLNDERAMSQRHSPFRSVPTLVEYIRELIDSRTQ